MAGEDSQDTKCFKQPVEKWQ